MGEHDYMFLKSVKEMIKRHQNSVLTQLANCGHVCNIEQPEAFNRYSIDFIQQHSQTSLAN